MRRHGRHVVESRIRSRAACPRLVNLGGTLRFDGFGVNLPLTVFGPISNRADTFASTRDCAPTGVTWPGVRRDGADWSRGQGANSADDVLSAMRRLHAEHDPA